MKMKYCWICVPFITTIVCFCLALILQKPVISLCDLNKCPFCYGTSLCKDIKENKVTMSYNSFSDFVFNLLSVKNVYFANYEGVEVVLKKLGSNRELNQLNKQANDYQQDINNILTQTDDDNTVKNFQTCDNVVNKVFLTKLLSSGQFNIKEVWTLLQINVESLILELFKYENGWWPFPKFYGSCGRLIIIHNCGSPLNDFKYLNWFKRAYLSLQLLQAAIKITEGNEDFRLYLTDISPDNIVVDNKLDVYFIDLENVILANKFTNFTSIHYSEHFDDGSYHFSPEQICRSSISDHNIYSVCYLLLHDKAPWPMMENGLLHSTPKHVADKYSDLFISIDLCVISTQKSDRFEIALEIINILLEILSDNEIRY